MTARASTADSAGLALWTGDSRARAAVPEVDEWLEKGDSARPGTVAAMATAAGPAGAPERGAGPAMAAAAVTAASPKRVTTGLCMRETGLPGGVRKASESIRSSRGK